MTKFVISEYPEVLTPLFVAVIGRDNICNGFNQDYSRIIIVTVNTPSQTLSVKPEDLRTELFSVTTSEYDVPQNGTFCSETVKYNGENVFYWSDNNGLNGYLSEEELEIVPAQIKALYESFVIRDNKYRMACQIEQEDYGNCNLTAQGF